MYKWSIIITVVAYIIMMCNIYVNGENGIWTYTTVTLWYGVFGGIFACIYKKYVDDVDKNLLESEKLERSERICNACKNEGGKLKCVYYKDLGISINFCEKSENPDGKVIK